MRKKILLFTLFTFAAFCGYAQNLVLNGGCENPGTGSSNTPATWTNSGQIRCASTAIGGVKVNEGSYAYIENNPDAGSVTQTIDLGANKAGSTFDYSIDYASFSGAHDFSLLIEALNSADADLGDLYASGNITVSGTYQTHSGTTGAAVANTHKLRVTLTWEGQGGAHDAILDDLNISYNVMVPVELTFFEANAEESAVSLIWETASEEGNRNFEIQRSTNGKNFRTIGIVEGQGTTLETTRYGYKDETALKNVTYYYRLKQNDFDGYFDFSPVATAKIAGLVDLVSDIYPNPTQGSSVQMNYTATQQEDIQLDVYNTAGQLQKSISSTVTSGENIVQLQVGDLPMGTYFVHIQNGETRAVRKLVKY